MCGTDFCALKYFSVGNINRFVYTINTTWDGQSINHDPVNITLTSDGGDVRVNIEAPFFNDPTDPGGKPGQPFDKLWLYEGNVTHSTIPRQVKVHFYQW